MRKLILCCLMLASTAAFAETYRWVDPQGRTVYSDTPPPGRAHSVTKSGTATPAADEGGEMSFTLRKAVTEFPVVLYTSADCTTQCQTARELLNKRGIPFTEKMVQKPEDFEELKQLVGDAFVPSIKIGRQSYRGYEAGAWTNLLDLAGYPKTAPYGAKPSGGLSK